MPQKETGRSTKTHQQRQQGGPSGRHLSGKRHGRGGPWRAPCGGCSGTARHSVGQILRARPIVCIIPFPSRVPRRGPHRQHRQHRHPHARQKRRPGPPAFFFGLQGHNDSATTRHYLMIRGSAQGTSSSRLQDLKYSCSLEKRKIKRRSHLYSAFSKALPRLWAAKLSFS